MKYAIRVAHRGITAAAIDGQTTAQRLFLADKDDQDLIYFSLVIPGIQSAGHNRDDNNNIAPWITIIPDKFKLTPDQPFPLLNQQGDFQPIWLSYGNLIKLIFRAGLGLSRRLLYGFNAKISFVRKRLK